MYVIADSLVFIFGNFFHAHKHKTTIPTTIADGISLKEDISFFYGLEGNGSNLSKVL